MMVISDKEAFRVLGLPLGVDRDAIRDRYKQLNTKLAISKLPEDMRKLEQVTIAFSQLLPHGLKQLPLQSTGNKIKASKIARPPFYVEHGHFNSSSDDEVKGRNLMNGDMDKDRKKAEKRRAKKKKQKEKKKQEKTENDNPTLNDNDLRKVEGSDSESDGETVEEVQGIDPNSAFVAMVGKKIQQNSNGVNPSLQTNSNSNSIGAEEPKKIKHCEKNNAGLVEARQIRSRQLAMQGNEAANQGNYKRAATLFKEAIRLDPIDHRFFGNRSYCYDQLLQYDDALKDADKAISLAPEWPKGHFRRGRALKGLGKLTDSEQAFKQVLKFDPGCEDAIQEITKVRKRRIVEMGFTERQAKAAIKKYTHVQPALDALLAGEFQNHTLESIFFSDEEEEEVEEETTVWQPPPPPQAKDLKMNSPRNLEGLTSLWVGNVVPDVTEKVLIKLFSRYGQVTSVRQLKEKYCAFVNFTDKTSAGRAMTGLQAHELCGNKLLIKFPDNPIVNGSQNITIRKNKPTNSKTTIAYTNDSPTYMPQSSNGTPSPTSEKSSSKNNKQSTTKISMPKISGPVNGNECYFWRTTGCAFAESCNHEHIKQNEGIDWEEWQR